MSLTASMKDIWSGVGTFLVDVISNASKNVITLAGQMFVGIGSAFDALQASSQQAFASVLNVADNMFGTLQAGWGYLRRFHEGVIDHGRRDPRSDLLADSLRFSIKSSR